MSAAVIDDASYTVTAAPLRLIPTVDSAALPSVISGFENTGSHFCKKINQWYPTKKVVLLNSEVEDSGGNSRYLQHELGLMVKHLKQGQGLVKDAVGKVEYRGHFNVFNEDDAACNAETFLGVIYEQSSN